MTHRLKVLILLSIVIFFGTAFFRPDQEQNIVAIRKHFWIVKTHQSKKYDLIIYGDSRVYRGISPGPFRDDFKNYDIYNFGYSSASFSTFMLNEMEKRFKPKSDKKIIVLGITPYSLTEAARKDKQYKEELNRKKEEIIESMYLNPVLPFKWKSDQTDAKTNKKYEYFEEYHDDGWVASWQVPPNENRAIDSYINNFKNNVQAESLVDSLMIKIKGWKQRNITVFGFRPPVPDKMKEVELSSGFIEKDFVTRFRKAGGIWIDLDNKNYQTYDGSHLDKESAIKISGYISKKMRAAIDR
jgi:hypothetical protein